MRIGIYTEYFYPHIGGQEIRYYRLGKKLLKEGHSIDIYKIGSQVRTYNYEDFNIHEVAIIPEYGKKGGRSVEDLLRYLFISKFCLDIKHINYDVLIVNQMPIVHLLVNYKKIFNSTIFVLDMVEYWRLPFLGFLYKKITNYYDGFIALNRWVYSFLSTLLKRNVKNEKPILFLPPSIDYEKYRNDPREKNRYTILYVGRLVKHKNIPLLIYAMKYLYSFDKNYILNIVGDGPQLKQLIELVNKLGLSRNIRFYKGLEEKHLIELYKKSYLFVMPSKREGYSISTIEAMAAATPVITCNYKYNYARVLIEESNGGVVCSPDPKKIGDTILRLSSNIEMWDRMSKNALLYAKKHDSERIANMFKIFIHNLLIDKRNND